ncbi:MAG TPA: glycosyltransferase [Gaiellaceae bacterium]|nr:glycosyltransferase [Gaiellaceae bacterium]
MALRIATLETGTRRDANTPREWQRLLARTIANAEQAVARRDADALAALYGEVAGWSDPQRVFQGRKQITEAVFADANRNAFGDSWATLYATAADALLAALDAEPSEPVFLNYAGVLVYELAELGGAEALFRAAHKLDPTLPHLRENLAAVREQKRAKVRPHLLGPLVPRVKALGLKARRVAAGAKATPGLTISLCMIVKDEEEMLPGCLEAVADSVDEIVVVDTGSTDRTVEIAKSFGARVIDFPWNGSFSDARNAGLDAATGDWLFYLDADEHLVPEDAPKIRQLLGRTWREGFHLVETNYTGGEEAGTSVTHLALRIFRNRPAYRFEGRIHEQKTQHMPTFLPERFEATTIRIRHYGYLKNRISAKEKSRRNIELLELEAQESPSPFNAFNLGSEYLMLGDAATAATHFDRAWDELQAGGNWTSAGYAPILASRIALARRESGRIDDARAALAIGIAAMPDHTDLHFELALCARDEGDLAEAERLALHCLELGDAPARYASVVGSGTYLALTLLGELAERRGDAEAAERYYLRALDEHPDYVAPVLHAVGLMVARGADLAELRETLELDRPSAGLLAATACLEAGRVADAVELFGEVLDRQPGNDAARIGLAEAYLLGKDWAHAAEAAARVPDESPLAQAAAGELLFAHAAAGDAAALRSALASGTAAAATPADRQLYAAWADALDGVQTAGALPAAAASTAATALEALLRVQEFASFELLARVSAAIAVPRDDWREVLARMYLRRGYIDSAADEWLASANEQPSARAFVGLAQVAVARELEEDAAVFAQHALALDPSSGEAKRLVERLRERAAA